MIYKKTESLIEQLKEQYDLEYLKNQFKNVIFLSTKSNSSVLQPQMGQTAILTPHKKQL